MDLTDDNPSRGRLIEDYLFSGDLPAVYRSSADVDQQFAKPIEDEDMFALGAGPSEPRSRDTSEHSTKASERQAELMNRIKEQVLAKGLMIRPIGANKDTSVNLVPNQERASEKPLDQQIGESPARTIIRHALERRKKDKYGLYAGEKLTWDVYNDYLKKTICSNKRKVWDSFQGPTDKYNDEEELIEQIEEDRADDVGKESEEPSDVEGGERESNDESEDEDDENDDFEDDEEEEVDEDELLNEEDAQSNEDDEQSNEEAEPAKEDSERMADDDEHAKEVREHPEVGVRNFMLDECSVVSGDKET